VRSPAAVLARSVVDPSPTDAQKEAGNYRKENVSFQGIPISIENKRGAVRSGVNGAGRRWHCTLPADYGYIKRTEGADGDHVDVYVGPDPRSNVVFIVNQIDPRTKAFDEHKVMLGFDSLADAVKTYEAAFSDDSGRKRCGSVEMMSLDAFRHWLSTGKTKKPAAGSDIVKRALGALARS
jgi:hypothetical protein